MSVGKVAQVYYEGELYWVCTEKERAVLDEVAALSNETLLSWVKRGFTTVLRLAHAELARRGVSSG